MDDGEKWRILQVFAAVQAPPNFRHVASWCSSTHVASFRNIIHTVFALGETVSVVHRQKTRRTLLNVATPLHGPQNHWGSLAPTKERPLSENQMCCVL